MADMLRKIRKQNMNTCSWKVFIFDNSYLLFSLFLLPIMPSEGSIAQKMCSNFAAENATIFVNSALGNNSVICGTETRPCKSVSFAIRRLARQNTSTGLLIISAGFYEESEDLELDCSRGNLKDITLLGTRQTKQVPRFDFSLDVQLCNICIFDIHWKGSRPLLFNVFMSQFSLYQCTIQKVNITIVGSSSQIHLQDSTVKYCKSYRLLLPLISVTSLGYKSSLQIMNTSFLHNYGQLIIVADVLQTTINNSRFENNRALAGGKLIGAQFTQFFIFNTKFLRNAETLLEMEGVGNLNASSCYFDGNKVFSGSAFLVRGKIQTVMKHCVFAGTKSSLPGPVMRINGEAFASLLSCQFSCNSVNESTSAPPIMPADHHSVVCDNCSVDTGCTVHCLPGEFLSDDILCQPCPVGTFSPGIVLNKTTLECQKCPAGFYSSKTKSEVCAPCEGNKFSAKPGATFCSKCTNDFFSSQPGQASCSTLTVGFIVLTVVVSLLIFIPLIILFYRSIHSRGKKTPIRLNEVTQCLCADERQYYLVQT